MVSRKGFMKRRLHRGPATRRPFRNPLLNAMGYLSPLKSHLQRKKRKEKKRKKERKEGRRNDRVKISSRTFFRSLLSKAKVRTDNGRDEKKKG